MDTRLLRLEAACFQLLLERRDPALPLWRQFGARSAAPLDAWPQGDARPTPPNALDADPALTILSTHGLGWFHQPALAGARAGDRHGSGRDWCQDFRLVDVEADARHWQFTLEDPVARLRVRQHWQLDPGGDVVTTHVELENLGADDFRVDWLAAACVPLPVHADQVIGFAGRWSLEFQQHRETLGIATWRRDCRRGRNGHQAFPAVLVGSVLADDEGPVWGAHLAWSGNHTLLIEALADGRRMLQLGEWLAPGEVVLRPGERHRTPDALLSFSDQGLNGLAAGFHRHIRTQVLHWPGGQPMAPRPVHLNTWEAVYFRHDLPALKDLAAAAAEVGVERFVLDDGWFHRRNDDHTSLGDWWPDASKYPHGLGPLVEHVHALGMQFGLWVEPEMISPDSELFRAHPDWALEMAGRDRVLGRHQLVLDLARPEVADHLFVRLDTLLRAHRIDYLKWDMNRDLATAAEGADHRGPAAYRGSLLALYGLIDRLRAAHPALEIESCSSGGARADAGILRRTHRVWTSDCNDALTRISIQSGALRLLPPEVLGAHIGPEVSHTTGRRHSLAFRAAVAVFGHLGIEADVRELEPAARAELRRWVELHKRWRTVLHGGVLRQGRLPGLAWVQATSCDGRRALLAVYRVAEDLGRHMPTLPLRGLADQVRYQVRAVDMPAVPHGREVPPLLTALAGPGIELDGATLAALGPPLPPLPPETAVVMEIIAAGGAAQEHAIALE